MNIGKKSLKTLLATSALLLTAGAVYAQPVNMHGNFTMTTHLPGLTIPWTCPCWTFPPPPPCCWPIDTSSFITVDQDYSTPSPSLAYLFGVQIVLPSGGFSASDGTRSVTFGTLTQGSWTTSLHSEDDNFPAPDGIDAIAPSSLEGDLSTGFTVTYDWGDASCATTDTAGSYSGSYSGSFSNADWDSAQLIVVIDNTFAPQSITLKARECISGGYVESVYTLAP